MKSIFYHKLYMHFVYQLIYALHLYERAMFLKEKRDELVRGWQALVICLQRSTQLGRFLQNPWSEVDVTQLSCR